MIGDIREAQPKDLDQIVKLAEDRRQQYESYQPTFWRRAKDSEIETRSFLQKLMGDADTPFFVLVSGADLMGFLVTRKIVAPPVYDPGGATYLIDDFCVSSSDLWNSVGVRLLEHVSSIVKKRGASQVVVVCGDRDFKKAEALRRAGLTIASNWWTAPL